MRWDQMHPCGDGSCEGLTASEMGNLRGEQAREQIEEGGDILNVDLAEGHGDEAEVGTVSDVGRSEQFHRWAEHLRGLLVEMEEFYGERPSKLENLTRYAWEEAEACERRGRDQIPLPPPTREELWTSG